MTQFTKRFCLDLSDAFASDLEVLSDFFQRMVCGLTNAEAFSQDFFLTRRQGLQRPVDLALQVIPDGGFKRRDRLLIFDKVAQVTVFFLSNRGLQ